MFNIDLFVEMLLHVVQLLVLCSASFFGFYNFLAKPKKLRKIQERALCLLLKNQILTILRENELLYDGNEKIRLEIVAETYKAYKDLGGNGFIDTIYDKACKRYEV